MKRLDRLSLIFFLSLLFFSCNKIDDVPKCINDQIKEIKSEERCFSYDKVIKYEFQGEEVYLFEADYQCGNDLSSMVMDSDCNVLGHLGGIQGNTEINGEEFSSAKEIKVVWSR